MDKKAGKTKHWQKIKDKNIREMKQSQEIMDKKLDTDKAMMEKYV